MILTVTLNVAVDKSYVICWIVKRKAEIPLI